MPTKRASLTLSALSAIAVAATLAPAGSAAAAGSGRVVLPLDEGWRFVSGDPAGAPDPGFDASRWERVDIPHDMAIAGPFREDAPAGGDGAFLPTGVAWYRRELEPPDSFRGKHLFVEFDGVMSNSEVFLNGESLGRRPNGYVGFAYELTPRLRTGPGATNTLAVRADTSGQVASRWYTGSGVYRHARLIAVEPLHVARHGVFVTTPEVTPGRARAAAAIRLNNRGESPREAVVRFDCVDAHGAVVATAEGPVDAAPGPETNLRLEAVLNDPRLWRLDDPALYTAVVTVKSGGEVVDRVEVPFGIRTAEFRADTGFWLNGRNLKLQGVCLHHDGGALGAAVPAAIWEDRLRRLKGLGVNAIRTAHNPPAPEFLDLCDRLGLLVMDEFFDCWTVAKRPHDYHRHFREWWRRDLVETIRRDRNHPSIILYSVGNEIRDTTRAEHAKGVLRELVDACHATDPTRPVTQALFRPNTSGDYDNGLADLLDVIGTNYRDAELLQAWRDNPSRRIVGTEQPHERSNWLLCRDNPQHAGQFLWVGIDYLGESRRWPVTTFNSGLLDRTGALHPRGAQRQSWWSDRPVVSVYRREAPTEATPADPGYEAVEWRRRKALFADWSPHGSAPHEENVEVYSNCDEVELLLNGRSLGTLALPTDARPRNWRVAYVPGELVAVGRNGGEEVARCQLHTAGPPASVRLTTSRTRLSPRWDDVAIVRAEIVDADGVRSPRATGQVTFALEGPGEVVAVDNGSIVDLSPLQTDQRRAHRGRCVAIVRVTAAGGEARLTARSEGLAPGTVVINAIRHDQSASGPSH